MPRVWGLASGEPDGNEYGNFHGSWGYKLVYRDWGLGFYWESGVGFWAELGVESSNLGSEL